MYTHFTIIYYVCFLVTLVSERAIEALPIASLPLTLRVGSVFDEAALRRLEKMDERMEGD